MYKYFNKIGNTKIVSERISKGLSDEVIKLSDNSLAPTVKYTGKRMYVKFNGSCLKLDKVTLNHGKTVNIYIAYDLKSKLNNFHPNLAIFLFAAVKLIKNSDIHKYKYCEYGFGLQKELSYTQVVQLVKM